MKCNEQYHLLDQLLYPGYKHKTEGRNMLVYTIPAMSRGKKGLQCGIIKPSMLAIEVQTKQKNVDQVRIVPRKGFYVVEVVYKKEVKQLELYSNGELLSGPGPIYSKTTIA
jgi:hypothetical protein